MKFLYLKCNFSPKVLLKMARGTYKPLTKERHLSYQSAFRVPDERYGTVAFLNFLFDFDNRAWKISEKLKDLPEKKVLLLWGAADKSASLTLASFLSNSRLSCCFRSKGA